MRIDRAPKRWNALLGALSFLLGSCGYKPCSDLKEGDVVLVKITTIESVEGCPPEFDFALGSEFQLIVEGRVRGEWCEGVTGEVRDLSERVRFSEPLKIADESEAFGDFYGRYEVETSSCRGSGRMAVGVGNNIGRDEEGVGIDFDFYSEDCDARCYLNTSGTAKRL